MDRIDIYEELQKLLPESVSTDEIYTLVDYIVDNFERKGGE